MWSGRAAGRIAAFLCTLLAHKTSRRYRCQRRRLEGNRALGAACHVAAWYRTANGAGEQDGEESECKGTATDTMGRRTTSTLNCRSHTKPTKEISVLAHEDLVWSATRNEWSRAAEPFDEQLSEYPRLTLQLGNNGPPMHNEVQRNLRMAWLVRDTTDDRTGDPCGVFKIHNRPAPGH